MFFAPVAPLGAPALADTPALLEAIVTAAAQQHNVTIESAWDTLPLYEHHSLKLDVLRACARTFKYPVPDYRLGDMATPQDVVTFYSTPWAEHLRTRDRPLFHQLANTPLPPNLHISS